MSDLLEQYKAYYRTRANQFAQDPDYCNSFEAENKLAEAMESCNELIDFKDKIGSLNELCSIALIKDDSQLEYKLYDELKEDIRKLASHRILQNVDSYSSTQEAISDVIEIQNKNSIEISMDEMIREVFHDWSMLERIQEFEQAEVPNHRKQENLESAQLLKERIVEKLLELEKSLQEWENNWKADLSLIWEERHFRLLPYPKAIIEKRFIEMKSIINR